VIPYEGPIEKEFWVVWKRQYMEPTFITRCEYLCPTLADAERLAEGFRCQLSVVDVKIVHVVVEES
jgi:hypothetical protein